MIKLYDYLDPSYSLNRNNLVIHRSNSLSHELAKFFCYYENISNPDNIVITEARFKTKGRADLVVFNNKTHKVTAIEIIHSEGKESVERKKEDYPVDVIFLESEKVINYWLDKLN